MVLKKMILKYIISILTNLKEIHAGEISSQIESSVRLGVLLSAPTLIISFLLEHITNWWIGNYDYIIMVLLAIAVDHLLGTYKHAFIDKDFSMLKNIGGLSLKIGLVVAIGLLFEGLNVIVKHDTIIKDYLVIVTRLIVFLYPAGSAFGNSAVITGGVFPPTEWIRVVKKFQSNLNSREFGPKNKNDDQS